jgi:3' terminal RNA ribose 2'-O-methyltransferase Hen1
VLVTIGYTAPGASDLGYLLHKHPAKLQTFDIAAGRAHVFYPEATDERCTVALLVEIDPIELARSKRFGGDAQSLGHYVNDRPYASSSMVAVALGKVFRTAMTGRSDSHPELAAAALPLEIAVRALPARGGADLVAHLFSPLGWSVRATPIPLDSERPDWGESRYVDLVLTGEVRLSDALRHLYVLLPVLDDSKHYWVGDDEVGKLLRAGEGWLAGHPDRELITARYLAHQRSFVRDATARLAEIDGLVEPDAEADARPSTLGAQRLSAVLEILTEIGARRVVDLGCGEGALLVPLAADRTFTEIVGTDVSAHALARAGRRLKLHEAPDRDRERIRLLQSSVTYEDDRIAGLDAAVLMEVVEHLDPERLPAAERSVFGHARPASVIVTTPNAEYNVRYPTLAAGAFRHPDHRFEWSRDEFREWAHEVAHRYRYDVEIRGVGPDDPEVGTPTQLALFRRVTP